MSSTPSALPPTPPTDATGNNAAVVSAPNSLSSASIAAAPDFMQFVPLVAIFAIFYFLIIRPQQARMKEHQNMMNALKKGDRIVTGGGIIGTVVHAAEGQTEITVDLNDSTRVSVLRATIASVIKPDVANDDTASKKTA